MRMLAAVIAAVGCGSPPSPAPETPPKAPPAPVVSVDAAPAPDAGIPDELATAPAWVFRYNAPGRVETWTLRRHDESALLVVEAASGTTRYVGTMSSTGKLEAQAANAKMALDCKPDKLAASATKCNDTKAKKIEVLNCFHPDIKTPMTFAHEPGVEFVTSTSCNGYRLIAP
jgi:hypothetical protein